jgi:putative DNA primase/helicase
MAVEGLKCVLENKEFTTCELVEQEMEEYENQNNSVVSFLNNGDVKIENESVGDVYLSYSVYCRESNLQALSKIAFSKEIQKQANVVSKTTSVAGRSIRVFMKN